MPCDELNELQKEQDRIAQAQRMLRENRRHLESGEAHDMKKQLQKDALDLVAKITAHLETCSVCKENKDG
jgi:hypothetical protein